MTSNINTTNASNLVSIAQYAIGKERSKIKALKKFSREINKAANTVGKILGRHLGDSLNANLEPIKTEMSMWAYHYEYADTLDLSISGRIEGLDSLKDERLTAVLDEIEKALGMEFDSSQDETWRSDPSREFATKSKWSSKDDLKLEMRVKISASARSDSPTCRKVQTGVKMEETPVYEIQCA